KLEIAREAFGKATIDTAVLLLVGNGKRQHVLFGQIGKSFHGQSSRSPAGRFMPYIGSILEYGPLFNSFPPGWACRQRWPTEGECDCNVCDENLSRSSAG